MPRKRLLPFPFLIKISCEDPFSLVFCKSVKRGKREDVTKIFEVGNLNPHARLAFFLPPFSYFHT